MLHKIIKYFKKRAVHRKISKDRRDAARKIIGEAGLSYVLRKSNVYIRVTHNDVEIEAPFHLYAELTDYNGSPGSQYARGVNLRKELNNIGLELRINPAFTNEAIAYVLAKHASTTCKMLNEGDTK